MERMIRMSSFPIYQLPRDHCRKIASVVELTSIKINRLVPTVTPKVHPLKPICYSIFSNYWLLFILNLT